jgi:CRISPR/Cas system-associated exonuclease Cas4 (RecB family)
MPVEHIVLFKTTRAFTKEERTSICSKIKQIPGVLDISVGQNYTTRSLEYNQGYAMEGHPAIHAFRAVTFPSLTALAASSFDSHLRRLKQRTKFIPSTSTCAIT